MARLIDADNRIAEIKKIYCDGCNNYGGVKCRACWVYDAMCLIDDATITDAVEVVRCKDCKFGDWDSEPNDAMVCMRTKDGFWRSGNDFCSFGERKEGAE